MVTTATIAYTTESVDATERNFGFTLGCVHPSGETGHWFPTYAAAEQFLFAELDVHGNTGHLAICGDDHCATDRISIVNLSVDPYEDYFTDPRR